MASVSTDGYLYLWNCQTGQQVLRMPHHTSCPIRVCCFSPSSAFLATAGDDEKVCVWDISTRSLVQTFTGHGAMVTTCSFSPDSTYIISGSSAGDLRMWDCRHGKEKSILFQPEAHDLGVLSSDFNPQYEINSSHGSLQSYYLFASCGNDELVKLWHIKGGQSCSISLFHCLSGHSGNIYSCKFSQDGSLLASAGYDKSIILWLVESGTMLHRLDGHQRFVTCCAFSADDSLLATASNDKTVIVWNLNRCLNENPANIINGESSNCRTEGVYGGDIENTNIGPEKTGRSASLTAVINANNVSRWSVDQVVQWLDTLGLEKYSEVFMEHQVDGVELLHLSHDSLLTVLKITILAHRNKLLRAIQGLKNPLWQHLSVSDDDNSLIVPEELYCPITHEVMKEPVVASDGYSYEQEAISRWVASNDTSPMTNEIFEDKNLIPNRTLKLLIKRYTAT
ncbi:WD repeat, SAM and U-box domain-containing protein 1-like isoform X2 [Brevipalpus obovatus]